MKNFHMNRILNLNTVEAYFLRDGYLIPPKYCMILIDYKRPSTIEDFPHLKDIEGIPQDEFGEVNFIKAIIISAEEVDEETYEELYIIPSGFLEDKEECRWDFIVETDSDFSTKNNLNDIFPLLQRLLKKHNCSLDIEKISEEKFNFLSQE